MPNLRCIDYILCIHCLLKFGSQTRGTIIKFSLVLQLIQLHLNSHWNVYSFNLACFSVNIVCFNESSYKFLMSSHKKIIFIFTSSLSPKVLWKLCQRARPEMKTTHEPWVTPLKKKVKDFIFLDKDSQEVLKDFEILFQRSLSTSSSFEEFTDSKLNRRRRLLQLIIIVILGLYVMPVHVIQGFLYYFNNIEWSPFDTLFPDVFRPSSSSWTRSQSRLHCLHYSCGRRQDRDVDV